MKKLFKKEYILGFILGVLLAGAYTVNAYIYNPTGSSGSGTVTSVSTDSTLTGGPCTTTCTIGIDLTHSNTWTGSQTISTAPFIISGNQSATQWLTNGQALRTVAATYTDTSSTTGTTATNAINSFGIPTLVANNTGVIYTVGANVYIAGSPISSTNVTQTSAYALFVASGQTGLLGGLQTGTTTTNSNFFASGSSSVTTSSNAALLFAGSSSISYRVGFNGNTSNTLAANISYANEVIGSSPITTTTSGTNALLANLVINPIGTVTVGSGSTITSTATVYINGAGSGGTTNYSLWDVGNSRIDGNLTLGVAGNKISITTGSNASAGTGTLSGGTVTINTTAVTASSLIFLTDTAGSVVNVGSLTVSSKSAGVSFTVNSTNVADTSTFNWLIIN